MSATGASPSGKAGKERRSRRHLMLALGAGALTLGAGSLARFRSNTGYEPSKEARLSSLTGVANQPERIISLSPGITETLVALGKEESIVGISDYCPWLAGNKGKPARVGSAITPGYERIAALNPSLIIASDVAGQQLQPLSKLAATHSFPWLSLSDVLESLPPMGALLQAVPEAAKLASQFKETLAPQIHPESPRVLLALDYGESGNTTTWFIRRKSMHGALLEAAGGRNAVDRAFKGSPQLSPEQLLALDPPAIIVLRPAEGSAAATRKSISHFNKWAPLRAVKDGKIAVLSDPNLLTVGPGLFSLIPKLKSILKDLQSGVSGAEASRPRESTE